jgi:hypothetical protein
MQEQQKYEPTFFEKLDSPLFDEKTILLDRRDYPYGELRLLVKKETPPHSSTAYYYVFYDGWGEDEQPCFGLLNEERLQLLIQQLEESLERFKHMSELSIPIGNITLSYTFMDWGELRASIPSLSLEILGSDVWAVIEILQEARQAIQSDKVMQPGGLE